MSKTRCGCFECRTTMQQPHATLSLSQSLTGLSNISPAASPTDKASEHANAKKRKRRRAKTHGKDMRPSAHLRGINNNVPHSNFVQHNTHDDDAQCKKRSSHSLSIER